jgi:hypothetical protein
VIKKKSGKWRMLTDLGNISKIIQPMGPLQPGLPQPAMVPASWKLKIIDLKDCFFTIHLNLKIEKNFPFPFFLLIIKNQ